MTVGAASWAARTPRWCAAWLARVVHGRFHLKLCYCCLQQHIPASTHQYHGLAQGRFGEARVWCSCIAEHRQAKMALLQTHRCVQVHSLWGNTNRVNSGKRSGITVPPPPLSPHSHADVPSMCGSVYIVDGGHLPARPCGADRGRRSSSSRSARLVNVTCLPFPLPGEDGRFGRSALRGRPPSGGDGTSGWVGDRVPECAVGGVCVQAVVGCASVGGVRGGEWGAWGDVGGVGEAPFRVPPVGTCWASAAWAWPVSEAARGGVAGVTVTVTRVSRGQSPFPAICFCDITTVPALAGRRMPWKSAALGESVLIASLCIGTAGWDAGRALSSSRVSRTGAYRRGGVCVAAACASVCVCVCDGVGARVTMVGPVELLWLPSGIFARARHCARRHWPQ